MGHVAITRSWARHHDSQPIPGGPHPPPLPELFFDRCQGGPPQPGEDLLLAGEVAVKGHLGDIPDLSTGPPPSPPRSHVWAKTFSYDECAGCRPCQRMTRLSPDLPVRPYASSRLMAWIGGPWTPDRRVN